MKRDESLAVSFLDIVERLADLDGLALPLLRGEHTGRHGDWTTADQYNLDLLIRSGHLSCKPVGTHEPAMVQLTWSGHDLLEKLNN